jgi:hypothetical protein
MRANGITRCPRFIPTHNPRFIPTRNLFCCLRFLIKRRALRAVGKYFPKKAIKETRAVGLSARGVHLRASIHHAARFLDFSEELFSFPDHAIVLLRIPANN